MSKHWQPRGKIVRLRPVGDWTSAAAYAPKPGRGFAVAVLGGAMALGISVGAVLSWSEAPAPAPAVPPAAEIVIPEVEADPADAEWAARAVEGEAIQRSGLPRAAGVRNDVVRTAFGFCHSGGGTNCVVDGDTFYLSGAKVRIAGIDAPETHPPRCAYEAEFGARATEQLHALLNSCAVTMTGTGRNRDKYGRLLRDVQVDGTDVGAAMVGAGVARAYGRGRRGWCG